VRNVNDAELADRVAEIWTFCYQRFLVVYGWTLAIDVRNKLKFEKP